MRKTSRVYVVAVSVIVAMAAAGAGSPTSSPEVARIQAHLAAVTRTLRATATDHLTEEQHAARLLALDWLDEYRSTGLFPHNHVRPRERVPVFVDPHGTPCAVGYLLLRSGEDEMVEEIVRANNLVRVPELRDDVRFADWLHAHGLTLEEAALIQPGYDWYPPPAPAETPPVAAGYRPATVGLSLASVALATYVATTDAGAGGLWPDMLAAGTAIGHTFLILGANDTAAEEPTWALGLNLAGLVTSVATLTVRIARAGEGPQEVGAPLAVRPHIAPGPNGTEIGVALRH
jgi:hypothetical protein